MSSALEKYVTEFMISKDDSSDLAKESAENIVSLINNENQQKDVKTSLLNLIQCLGQYLVHEDDTIRAKSTGLLSNTIDKCDQSQLTEQSVGVLVNFYSSRLSDQASVPNLMTGLVALTSKFDHFNSNCTNAVLNGLIKEVRVQAYPHITRNATFKVFENLLDFHCADLEPVNDIFIRAVTNSMTGEKDPRNLMIVYTIIQKIVRSLDIANQVEELFEATFCYFPITFKPPPDNPYGITAKDLKSNLRKCFASTPLFAKLGLPLLIQKMTTTSGSAKKDALQTITACAPVYDASELRRVGIKLYDAVKVEIISQSPDPSLREYSLDAIHALTKAMTINAADPLKDEETTNILKSLVDDCALLLEELEEDNVKPASLILRAAASASPFAYSYIETRIVPMVLRQYREHDDMADRYLILCTLVAIIQARKIVFGATTNVDENVDTSHDSVLVSYKDRLTEIFSSALKASNEHPQIRLMGVLGLGLLCALKGYMSRSERGINIQSLNTVLETEEEEKLRMPLEVSLIEISNFDPELITHLTIPALMKLLPDFSSSTEITGVTNPVSYKLTLKTIEKLSAPPTIYKVTEKKLLEKFFLICGHNEDKKYATEVIRTLLNIIEAKDVAKHRDLKGGTSNLLPQLISAVIAAYSESESNDAKAVITSNEVMQVVYLIFQNIIKNMSSEEQQTYIVDMFKLFKENDLSTIDVSGNAKFDPNSVNASDATAACTQMFSTIVCSLRKEVRIPMESNELFLNDVVERAVNNSHQPQVTSLARIVASVINKWKEGDSLQAYLSALIPRLEALIEAKSLAALTLYIWVAKALITRSHKLGLQLTENIIKLIPDSVIGKQAACGFDILLGDDPLCLIKQCFANVSLLHKQKFMAAILPKLLNEFHQAHDEDRKLNYLIGIAYLLKNVPKAILIDELPPLVPLLIDSLSFADTVLKLSTLDLFAFSLSEATHVMAKNIKELLPAFISLIGPTEKSMQVRIAALKCIDLVSVKVSRDIVLPYTKETLKAIAVPLDDKKRLVRKQAVECRESWYLIGQKK